MMRSLLAFFCVFLLVACAEMPNPMGKPVAQQGFSYLGVVVLPVQEVLVKEPYRTAAFDGDIAKNLIFPPDVALLDYLNVRFRAREGAQGRVLFSIEEAFVTEREIIQDNGLVRWTGLANEDEYRYFITLNISDESGRGATIKMDRTLVISQRKSIAEKEDIQSQFIDKMIRDLDVRIMAVLREQLGIV